MGDNSRAESELSLLYMYATRLLSAVYILVKYHENILKGSGVIVCVECYNFGRRWEITHEPS